MNSDQIAVTELERSEEHFRTLANMVPEILWTSLPNGYEDFHNKKFLEYTGLNAKEAEGFGWQQNVHPDDLQAINKAWNTALQNGTDYEIEYRIKNSKSEYYWFLVRASSIKDESGNILKWFGISTNINYGKSLRLNIQQKSNELKNTNHELIKVNDMLNHFVYIAAHDLKSPVNNLMMLSDLLNDESDNDKKEELWMLMEKSILRLDRTVNGLVEVIQHANEDSNAHHLLFEEILSIVISDLSISYPDISLHISADFSKCPSIKYVKPFIISILKNLVSNSYKYQSQNRKLLIQISTERYGAHIKLEVKDNGIGYDMTSVKNIFEPFKRFSGQSEGTGVGLYVLKNLVEKNGGKVEAWGKEDQGAVFTVYLKEYNT